VSLEDWYITSASHCSHCFIMLMLMLMFYTFIGVNFLVMLI